MSRLISVLLLCAACGAAQDPLAGRWELTVPDAGVLDMDLVVQTDNTLSGTGVLRTSDGGSETSSVSGQRLPYADPCALVILRFSDVTLEPLCRALAPDRMQGTVYFWGDGGVSYPFVATRP